MHGVAGFLHAAFEQIGDAELLADLRKLSGALLYFCVEVREMTLSAAIFDNRVRISS